MSRRLSDYSKITAYSLASTKTKENMNLAQTCSEQLKECLIGLDNNQLSTQDLLSTLQHAIFVLETIFVDRTKRNMSSHDEDEDEILSITASNPSLPGSIKDWICTTFSRRTSIIQPPRKRLRSLANAVRVGLAFDRIFRRMSLAISDINLPTDVMLFTSARVHEWNFDIFTLDSISQQHSLKAVAFELLQYYKILNHFSIPVNKVEAFLIAVEEGYSLHGNPYHNVTHGADVMQTVHVLLKQSKLSQWLSELEVFSAIFAAMIHDYEHTGTTNNYHIVSQSNLAMIYNDRSVLENYHVSAIFQLLHSREECNILANLSQVEYCEFRKSVISMVLATDMSVHFAQVQAIKEAIPVPENLPRVDIMSYIIHAADIAHPAKAWDLHQKWTTRLMEEFFKQGDKEKEAGRTPSPLCDRNTTVIPQCQLGFIQYIVEPCFNTLNDLLDAIMPLLKQAIQDYQATSAPEDDATSVNAQDDSLAHVIDKPWTLLIADNQKHWNEVVDKGKHSVIDKVIVEEEDENGNENDIEELKNVTIESNGQNGEIENESDNVTAELSIIEELSYAKNTEDI